MTTSCTASTRNPHDHARSPGGSSSGEAALVAAGASPLGIGSDSGGSIRGPAAWCGVAGFKPSAGRVSNIGHFPRIGALHDGRTQIGPLARNIDDLALALEVIAGFDGIDPGVVPVPLGSVADVAVASLRVAWFTHDDPGHPSDAVAEHVELAVRALADAGATVVADPVPAHLAEALDITQRYWGRRQLSGPEADDLLWDWDRFRRRQLEFAQTVDIVVSPATPDVASLVPSAGLQTRRRRLHVAGESHRSTGGRNPDRARRNASDRHPAHRAALARRDRARRRPRDRDRGRRIRDAVASGPSTSRPMQLREVKRPTPPLSGSSTRQSPRSRQRPRCDRTLASGVAVTRVPHIAGSERIDSDDLFAAPMALIRQAVRTHRRIGRALGSAVWFAPRRC